MKKYAHSKAEDFKKQQEIEKEDVEEGLSNIQQEAFDTIRSSFEDYYEFFKDIIYPEYIRIYKHKRLYTGDRYLKLKKANLADKSNIKYPLIPSIHDTYYSNTFDSQTSIKAIPSERTDVEKAKVSQSYVERAFSVSNGDEHCKQMDFEASLIGPGYGKVGFIDSTEEYIYVKDGVEVSTPIIKKKPTVNYVDVFSLCFNPFAGSFYTAQKFYRNILPVGEVKEIYSKVTDISDGEWMTIISDPKYFSTDDYKRVRILKGFENQIKSCVDGCTPENKGEYEKIVNNFTDDKLFHVDYNESTIEVVEYRDPISSKMVLFFNGYAVFDGASPRPFEGDPFVRVAYQEQPGSLFPVGIGQKLESIQNNIDAFVNNWIDVVNQYANPAFIADKGVFGADTSEVLKVRPGKVYERIMNKYIEVLKTVDPNAVTSLLNGIQFYISQAYEIAGLNTYTQGGQGKIERTAGGVNQRVQVLKTALIPFFNNKNQMLGKLAEKRLAIGRVFMGSKFTVRLMGANGALTFVDISAEDLANKVDFVYDNQSLRSISRREERADVIEALQYAQDPMTRMLLEKKLLETFDMTVPTYDEKIKEAEEQFHIKMTAETGKPVPPQQPPVDPNTTSPGQNPQNIPNISGGNMQSVPSVPSQDGVAQEAGGLLPGLGRPKMVA